MTLNIVYLTVDDVVEIHATTIAEFGGADGIRSQELLESAVFQPQQLAFGEDAYPALFPSPPPTPHFLGSNRPFVDWANHTA